MGESTTAATTTLRLVVYRGEVCRLPANSRAITVREGVAWMTSGGADHILRADDHAQFKRQKWAPVVSAISGRLVIEVTGAGHPRSPSISSAARSHNACVSAGA